MIKYKDEDGCIREYKPTSTWQAKNAKSIAAAIAKIDYCERHPDLCDPSDWPMYYDILIGDKWVKVRVNLDYAPVFSAKTLTKRDDKNESTKAHR